jgi:MoxR-like ATPase
MQTRGQLVAADIAALLRARNPLLWVVTREEARAEGLLFEAAAAANYNAHTWDVAAGPLDFDGTATRGMADYADPGNMLDAISARSKASAPSRDLWIMRDLPIWLDGAMGAQTLRKLRNLARALPSVYRNQAQAIVILTTSATVPPDLAGHATVIEMPLPDRDEIAAILDAAIESLPDEYRNDAAPNGTRDAAIDAAVGLTGEEAAGCYARSLVQSKKIDPATVANEKKRIIARERVLEWFDPLPGGLDAVGGLDNLKQWLVKRRDAYSAKARAYGLPAPKGVFLAGVPGCGKSLTAKAVSTFFNCPLLRLDMGALKSKFVGDSVANIRKAFAVIAAIGRCVVWIDEIEKALAGGAPGASADGGVSSDALGAILNWMQERQGEAFVIATANDVASLPPELLRKGRFDEVFFVDLPTDIERRAILSAALKKNGRPGAAINIARVTATCVDFTGSEIAELVPDAMYAAFADDARELTTDDLLNAAGTVVPLAKTAEEKLKTLREWAKGRARPASLTPDRAEAKSAGRKLDI